MSVSKPSDITRLGHRRAGERGASEAIERAEKKPTVTADQASAAIRELRRQLDAEDFDEAKAKAAERVIKRFLQQHEASVLSMRAKLAAARRAESGEATVRNRK